MDKYVKMKSSFDEIIKQLEKYEKENNRLTNLLKTNQEQLKTVGRELDKAKHDNNRYQNRIEQLQKFIDDNYKLIPLDKTYIIPIENR